MSFKTVEGAEKRLSPSLESEAAPQGHGGISRSSEGGRRLEHIPGL